MPSGDAMQPQASFSAALVPSQPTRLLLPFFTQDRYVEKVAKAERLYASQQSLLSTIQDRLLKHNVSLAGLNQRFFSWLLPKNNASIQDWKALLSNPLLVDTETLKELFQLEQSTANSYVDERKNLLLYIRTFAFEVDDLLEVLQELLDDEVPSDTITSLFESIQGLPGDQIVYVRYAGQTTSGSAYTRHYADLMRRDSKFMTRFLQAVLRTAPEVIDTAEVHEIMDATITNFPYYDADLANKREQALIALLGMTVSLNTQIGGTWTSARPYVPSDTEIMNFNALRTTLMQQMHQKCTPCSDEMTSQINAYSQRVQAYTVANPGTTGSDNFPITDNVRLMIRDQAMPVMCGRFSLLVTVGSDLHPDAVSNLYSFFGGNVESGNFCAGVLNRLGSWEIGQYMMITAITVELQKARYLPFVDLFPWTKKTDSDLQPALALLRSYLHITKPIVLLTFSLKVSSAAVGSFQHPHGIQQKEYLKMIGKLIISKYDDDASIRNDDDCVIVIPCYHPGVVGYQTRASETYLRIISHVLMIVWLAMDRATKLCGEPHLSKKGICERVCAQVEALTGPSTTFGIALNNLKENLKKELSNRPTRATVHKHVTLTTRHQALGLASPHAEPLISITSRSAFTYDEDTTSLISSRNRWTAAKDELYQIVNCEIASPRAQRKEQIKRLEGMALPLLRHKDYEFRKLAETIGEGRSYYLEVSDRERRLKEVPNLMSLHLPKTSNPNSSAWQTDIAAVKEADANMQAWLKNAVLNLGSESVGDRCMFALTKLMQEKDEGLARRLRTETQAVVVQKVSGDVQQGCEIHIKPPRTSRTNCLLELEWESDGAKHKLKNFFLPGGVLPLDSSDKRYLYFVPGGIDIRDSQNHTLGLSSDRSNTVSLTTIHMILRKEACLKPFLALWEKETSLKVDDQLYGSIQPQPLGSTMVYPASYFRSNGRSWDSSRTAKAKMAIQLQASKPIQPEDAVWLFHKFLLQHYPNIGDVIDAGNPAKWPSPESATMWPKLETFLCDSKYQYHPQRANLMAVAKNATDLQQHRRAVATLSPVLTLLRGSIKVDSYTSSIGGQRMKKLFTIQGVAPADLLDPLRTEPPLVPYTTAQSIKDQGLIPMNDDEDDSEDDMAGPSKTRTTTTIVSASNDEHDADMLLGPEEAPRPRISTRLITTGSTALTREPPTDISHVGKSTVSQKRECSSPSGKGKGKKARRDDDDVDE